MCKNQYLKLHSLRQETWALWDFSLCKMGMMRVAKGRDLGLIKYSEHGLACNKPELLKLLLSISSAKTLGARKVTNYFLTFFKIRSSCSNDFNLFKTHNICLNTQKWESPRPCYSAAPMTHRAGHCSVSDLRQPWPVGKLLKGTSIWETKSSPYRELASPKLCSWAQLLHFFSRNVKNFSPKLEKAKSVLLEVISKGNCLNLKSPGR